MVKKLNGKVNELCLTMCKSNLLISNLTRKCQAQFAETQNVLLNERQRAFEKLKHFARVPLMKIGATANYSYT